MIDARPNILAETVEPSVVGRTECIAAQRRRRGRPRDSIIDAAVRAIEDNHLIFHEMTSRDWGRVYHASGVLGRELRAHRNLRSALKQRYRRAAPPKSPLEVVKSQHEPSFRNTYARV
jgi:hypothetical protein